MERLNDDILGLILSWVVDPNDKKSFSLVSKHWLTVEGLNRTSLRVFELDLLRNFLPRFPKLLTFSSSEPITNSEFEFLVQTCPKLEVLDLNYRENSIDEGEIFKRDDVDDRWMCMVGAARSCFTEVYLRRRMRIGDFGVVALANCSENLKILDIMRCKRITDKALEAIGGMKSLEVLNLQGCWLITDVGLALLASGSVCTKLKKLDIAECDKITDFGLLYLKEMCFLEELNLAECGLKVTDVGGLAVAGIRTIKMLNLSWLINLSDVTLVTLARDCCNLVAVDFRGCESITGSGLRAFANHGTLEVLGLVDCHNFNMDDIRAIVFRCRTLHYIALDKRLKMWTSTLLLNQIIEKPCLLDWR